MLAPTGRHFVGRLILVSISLGHQHEAPERDEVAEAWERSGTLELFDDTHSASYLSSWP